MPFQRKVKDPTKRMKRLQMKSLRMCTIHPWSGEARGTKSKIEDRLKIPVCMYGTIMYSYNHFLIVIKEDQVISHCIVLLSVTFPSTFSVLLSPFPEELTFVLENLTQVFWYGYFAKGNYNLRCWFY